MTTVQSDGWSVTRSRVSLAGRVAGADGDIAGGGVLNLTSSKGAAGGKAASASSAIARRYETRIRPDGFYFFLDLPAGDYVLDGEDQHGNKIVAKPVSIPSARGSRPSDIVSADLTAATPAAADQRPVEAPAPGDGQAGASAAPRAVSPVPRQPRKTKR